MSVRSASGKSKTRPSRRGSALSLISEDDTLSLGAGSEPGLTLKSSEFSVSSRTSNSNNSREFAWRSDEGSGELSGAFSVASLRSKDRSEELTIISGSRKKPQHQAIAELTINKLKVDSIGLIGREQEVEQLACCFERLMSTDFHDVPAGSTMSFGSTEFSAPLVLNQPKKELVFISGLSGVGKSSVGRTIKKNLASMEEALYVEGKFDFNTANEVRHY